MIPMDRGRIMSAAQRIGHVRNRFDFHLPDELPRFSPRVCRFLRLLWLAAFLFAIVTSVGGLWIRFTSPTNNSQLLLGSRVGAQR